MEEEKFRYIAEYEALLSRKFDGKVPDEILPYLPKLEAIWRDIGWDLWDKTLNVEERKSIVIQILENRINEYQEDRDSFMKNREPLE